jgi:hypothetical protein
MGINNTIALEESCGEYQSQGIYHMLKTKLRIG